MAKFRTTKTTTTTRKRVTRAALVVTAIGSALALAAGPALADSTAAGFNLSQPDWYAGASTYSSSVNLQFQSDGNLVLYVNGGGPIWASGSEGRGVTHVDWSQSGYVKLLNSGNGVVCELGQGNPAPGGWASVQDDGNFVFYNSSGRATWASNTQFETGSTVDACGF
ncbi:hypothetical protein P3T36_003780 [Kitasatospora sp. MAP12-15]|uniref:hypothetical protein n=1 Tax=unclassified Kitasatospora TaxID=2633591 RepID=UPI002474334E|nr:hypothetical protein [Kitasatospora sp. MAP12-44]MDH6112369.1 hypothetical protein [Kitasatospora sp. MAP12-44]